VSGLIVYTCPLGANRFASLQLPSDFNWQDFKRVVALLESLPLEPRTDRRICTCSYEPDENCPTHSAKKQDH
jgi:hypothetical protein